LSSTALPIAASPPWFCGVLRRRLAPAAPAGAAAELSAGANTPIRVGVSGRSGPEPLYESAPSFDCRGGWDRKLITVDDG